MRNLTDRDGRQVEQQVMVDMMGALKAARKA
jgi:hypothetical protein